MIPILYEKNEAAFSSNGLGRLRDCISCTVTEERNGIYECDFEYPINGLHYELIQVGRIIGVTHTESNDIQPFDIVSFTKPIDGIVTFHCTHISYRQSFMTVTGSNINSLSDAFTLFGTATPANPFTYSSDITGSGYMACADGVPRSVRQMLGGIEGSVLDTYGGEYEWDRWNVILHSARGTTRSFSIRYGVNMLTYDDEYDVSESYTSCIPYWTDGENTVVGSKVDSGIPTQADHGECVPLDLSDKFESQPTAVQVQNAATSYMSSTRPYLPKQTIKVSFARLQDMAGYEQLHNLEHCELCDTIKVIFPDYNTNGYFKIVKTVWNVLENKYEEMELGSLSASLSEALGISVSLNSGSGGGGGGVIQTDSDITLLTNNTGLVGTLANGTTHRTMMGMSTSNNVAINYDGYDNGDSGTNIYGNSVKLYSNNTITSNIGISIGGYLSGLYTEDVLLNDNVTISGSSYGNNSKSVSKTGFTPIGIVGMHLENASSGGTLNTYCAVHSFYLSGSTAYWIVKNTSTSQAKIKVTATILYVKN